MLWDGSVALCAQRASKEGSHDYRYFPEPDLPPLILDRAGSSRGAHDLPGASRRATRRASRGYKLGDYDVEVLTATRVSPTTSRVARAHGEPKAAANWVMGEVMAAIKTSGGTSSRSRVRPADLASLLGLVRDGVVSHTAGKQIFALMVATGDQPAQIAEREGLVRSATTRSSRLGRRGHRRASRRGGALPRRREEAAGRAGRRGDEEVEGTRRPAKAQSVA